MSVLAAETEKLRAELAAAQWGMRNLTREPSGPERAALERTQTRADAVAGMFGDRVSAPVLGESPLQYRRRALAAVAAHSPRFRNSRFEGLSGATLEAVETEVYADAATAAHDHRRAPPGQLLAVESRDAAGRTVTKFVGDIACFLAPFTGQKATGSLNRPKDSEGGSS